jgi:hypothetical protein
MTTFSNLPYRVRDLKHGGLVRQFELTLPKATVWNRMQQVHQKLNVQGTTFENLRKHRVDDKPMEGFGVAVYERDERGPTKQGKPLVYGDFNGRTPIIIPSGGSHYTEELAEMAAEYRHYGELGGQEWRPEAAPRPDYDDLIWQISERAKSQVKGRQVYGAQTRGQFNKNAR